MSININELNDLYKNIYQETKNINKYLSELYMTKITFANCNFEKHEDNWTCYYYPIPVIEINNKVDLNLNMFEKPYYFELFIKKEEINKFDFAKFINLFKNKNLAIYGGEDCLIDFWHETALLEQMLKNIEESNQKSIGLSIETNKDINNIKEDIKNILSCYDK